MGTSGVKVSRIGYDVNIASDKQLAFSSEWPLLPIEAEGDITIEAPVGGPGNVTVTIFEHNLGYIPVFYVLRVSGGDFFPYWVSCDEDKMYFFAYVTTDINLKWKIFRRPLKTNYTSVNTNMTDATKGTDDDYGLLVSLPGKDVNSTDKRDFCIRSDVRQLMIAKTGYTTTPTNQFVVTHNLGYKPMYFFYIESESDRYHFLTSASDLVISSTNDSLTTSYFSGFSNFAYIIFKDTLTTNG